MKEKAILKLIQVATEDIEARPIPTQVEIYDALAVLLPSEEERIAAARLAFALNETKSLQQGFNEGLHLSLTSGSGASGPARKRAG